MKGKISCIIRVLFCGALASAPAFTSASQVLHSNGTPFLGYGNELSGYQQAEDFKLTKPSLVEGFKLWTAEGFGIREEGTPFDGHIDYWIYENSDGKPSTTPVAQGTGQAIVRDDLGVQDLLSGPLHRYATTVSIEQPFMASEQASYFLAVHFLNYYPTPAGEMYWTIAVGPLTDAPSRRREGPSLVGAWLDNSQGVAGVYGAGKLAFEVIGCPVPEPASHWMLGIASLVMIWQLNPL